MLQSPKKITFYASYLSYPLFKYTNVAAPDVFEWGYRRGNDPEHFREEYLSQKAESFKAKLRWGDSYEVSIKFLYCLNEVAL